MHQCAKCACTSSAATATVRSQLVVSPRVEQPALIAADSKQKATRETDVSCCSTRRQEPTLQGGVGSALRLRVDAQTVTASHSAGVKSTATLPGWAERRRRSRPRPGEASMLSGKASRVPVGQHVGDGRLRHRVPR